VDPRRDRFTGMKLKSHFSLWCDKLQLNRGSCSRENIKTCDRIFVKLKAYFFTCGLLLKPIKKIVEFK